MEALLCSKRYCTRYVTWSLNTSVVQSFSSLFLADVCDVHSAGKGHPPGQAGVVPRARVSGLPHRTQPSGGVSQSLVRRHRWVYHRECHRHFPGETHTHKCQMCVVWKDQKYEKKKCGVQLICSRNSGLCYLLCMNTCFHEIPYMYIRYCLTLAAAARYLFIYSDDEWAPVECFLPAAEERDNNHLFPLWSSFFLVHLTEKGHRFRLQWLEGLERAAPWLGLTQPLHTKLYKYWSWVKHYIAIS